MTIAQAPTVEPPRTERPITESLAEATSATLSLARETSAPAARVGKQVLASATLPKADWPVEMPTRAEPAEVLQSVGSRVEEGVRPLSGAARSAFSFLLPSAPKAPTNGG